MKADQLPSLEKALAVSSENAVLVEIGTWEGGFSEALIKNVKFKMLYCIDPYRHFDDGSYPDAMNDLTQKQYDEKFVEVSKKLSSDKVQFLRMTSSEAALLFENNSVDYVYIDGNHEFKFVDEDIKNWFPKIKEGGFMCGDDVYSTKMEDYDKEKNLIKVWSTTPLSWGKYGTFPACIENERRFGIKFLFEGTQFSHRK